MSIFKVAQRLSTLVEQGIKTKQNTPAKPAPIAAQPQPVQSHERIMLIGDSLAQGLVGRIKPFAEKQNIPFIGKGIVSSHVSQWVNDSWFDQSLSVFKPTVVLISLGTNDCYSNVDLKSFENNVKTLLDKVKSAGARPVWIGNPKLPEKGLTGAPLRPEILQIIQRLAPAYIKSEDLNIDQIDKIHPTAGGYGLWAESIWSKINSDKATPTTEEKQTTPTKIFQNYKITNVPGINSSECGVMVPENPVKPDGSVDFIFAFKAFGSTNTNVAKSFGVNAVVISLFVNEDGDQKHLRFIKNFSSPGGSGPANYINYIREEVLKQISAQLPDKQVRYGKLLLLWWSGGFSAAAAVLKERDKIPGGIDSAVCLDGMWGSNPETMKVFEEYAEEAKIDPSKKFFVVYSNCPAKYKSASQNALDLAKKTSVEFKPVTGWRGEDINFKRTKETLIPKAVASSGGLHIVNLFGDNTDNPADQHTKANLWGQKNLVTYALS
jgi:lysophospholipase L1-like esterase